VGLCEVHSQPERASSCISAFKACSWCVRAQETFDVRGAFWWLRWLLPSFGGRLGSGLHLPTNSISAGGNRRSGGSQLNVKRAGL
jgi:hypothetical protein